MTKTKRSCNLSTRSMNPGLLAAPLAGFLKDLEQSGYTRLSIESYAMSVAHFGEWIQSRSMALDSIDEHAFARFAKHRCHCPGGRRCASVSPRYVRRVRRFCRFLEQRGFIQPGERPNTDRVGWPLKEAFCQWLRDHRGVGSITITHHTEQLHKMPHWLLRARRGLTATRVRSLILERAPQLSGSAKRWMTTALRMYLRFLGSTGRCPSGLEGAIPPIPQWRLSSLPRYLASGQVQKLVDACDTTTCLGARDRAVLLLLVRLGLRAGDVAGVCFGDLDWDGARVKVCGKAHRETWLPLAQDAGDAVIEYLKQRPEVEVDNVFLCANAPYRSIKAGVVSSIVDRALQRARIEDVPSRGASLLRHTAATSMLRAGATLDAVSAILRHRSMNMTVHYAKVDLPMLQQIVQPWPEGVSC
jgi:integrase/recombinase XerD